MLMPKHLCNTKVKKDVLKCVEVVQRKGQVDDQTKWSVLLRHVASLHSGFYAKLNKCNFVI